jgi:hypothetical protein
MATPTRPPLACVPLFLRCPRCDRPFRSVGSFLGDRLVTCAWCGRALRLRPTELGRRASAEPERGDRHRG